MGSIEDEMCTESFGESSEKVGENLPKPRKRSKKKELVVKEDISEEIAYNTSVLVEETPDNQSFMEDDSFQIQNTSMLDYKKNVFDLVAKTDSGWSCRNCPYNSISKHHMFEHVEKHITGYSFDCESCGKTYRTKASHRHHV